MAKRPAKTAPTRRAVVRKAETGAAEGICKASVFMTFLLVQGALSRLPRDVGAAGPRSTRAREKKIGSAEPGGAGEQVALLGEARRALGGGAVFADRGGKVA